MGILYIVATPIGNLEDLSFRALRILKEVNLIVCEDTRQTLKLLNHYNISKPLISYFQHSKLTKIEYIAEQLKQGKNIALVTDAGTPGISDPGGKLIEELLKLFPEQAGGESEGFYEYNSPQPSLCKREGAPLLFQKGGREELKIVPIPGPNAAIAALSISGLPADKFIFMGFPPHKKGREKFFREVVEAKYTVVFYESTHRILKTLRELSGVLPPYKGTGQALGRDLVVCRELTKQFESIYRGSAEEILKILESDKNNQKGEFVVVVGK